MNTPGMRRLSRRARLVLQRERQLAVVFSVACEHVEGTELRPLVVPARVQRCEVRDAVGAEHDRLAIEHEMLLAQFQRGRDYKREAPSPIMPAPTHQAHAALLADEHCPVAVVLHFVQPIRACWAPCPL